MSSSKQRRPSKGTKTHSKTQNLPTKLEAPTGNEYLRVKDFGVCALQGKRSYMEDCHAGEITLPNSDLNERNIQGYFAVFDGHGGNQTSKKMKEVFFPHIWSHIKVADQPISSNWKPALKDAFLSLESQMYEEWKKSRDVQGSGTTAVSIFIQSNQIICANVGDSRAVISRNGKAHALSSDQRPTRGDEKKRLEEASVCLNGKCVESKGYLLSISRTFADFEMKEDKKEFSNHPLAPNPEIKMIQPLKGDDFIILGSDGLWDVFSNQEAVDFVKDALRRFGGSAHKAAQSLATAAITTRKSSDNVTALIVTLDVTEKEFAEGASD